MNAIFASDTSAARPRGPLPYLRVVLDRMIARLRTGRLLRDLDDHLLRDIGVSRAEFETMRRWR